MQYRRFGKTELGLPVISCGGMRFQHSWNSDDEIPEDSQRNVEACMRKALDLGIHHIETARGYGTSEGQLGRILPTLPRDKILVQTKVNPNADPAEFIKIFEKSMGLLRLDYLDLFAFHGINNEEMLEYALRCYDVADKWRREGRIRHIGFATHGPADIVTKAVQTGLFEYVNMHYFYIYQNTWPAIVEARKRDMGVFIISPNEKGGLLFKPSPKLLKLTAPLHPMVFHGLFLLSHPEIHTLSCGVSKPEDFDIHMETVEKLDRAADLVAPIRKRIEDEMVHVLGKEWVETWEQGLPEWHETPGHVNIPVVLRLYNLVKAFDMIEYARMRYNLLGNADHWFPGNKADKVKKLDLSACLERSPHRDKIPALLAETHAMLKGKERKRLQQGE